MHNLLAGKLKTRFTQGKNCWIITFINIILFFRHLHHAVVTPLAEIESVEEIA